MPDSFYPLVELSFIEEHARLSGKLALDGVFKVGSMTTFVVAGSQAIFKRTIFVRELQPGEVCLEQATALALRFNFMGPLLEWLTANRKWKEGAYIVSQPTPVEQ